MQQRRAGNGWLGGSLASTSLAVFVWTVIVDFDTYPLIMSIFFTVPSIYSLRRLRYLLAGQLRNSLTSLLYSPASRLRHSFADWLRYLFAVTSIFIHLHLDILSPVNSTSFAVTPISLAGRFNFVFDRCFDSLCSSIRFAPSGQLCSSFYRQF